MDWKPDWIVELEQTWEQIKYYADVAWTTIVSIFNFPFMVAAYIKAVADLLPFNDVDLPNIIPVGILVYVVLRFFFKSFSKRGLISSIALTFFLAYALFIPLAYGGLYPPIIMLFVAGYYFDRERFAWLWDRIRGASSTGFSALRGATRITSSAVKGLGSAAKYRGDPVAKYCAASFGSLMEAFETEPELLKHGELDKPAFLATMAEMVKQLTSEFEDHAATIDSIATDIENGLQSTVVDIQAGAKISKEVLRRLTP